MCDCIETIDAKLAPDHHLNCTMAFRAGELPLPIINLIRRDTWKPETRRGRVSFIVASFCPFCGERYEAAKAEAA